MGDKQPMWSFTVGRKGRLIASEKEFEIAKVGGSNTSYVRFHGERELHLVNDSDLRKEAEQIDHWTEKPDKGVWNGRSTAHLKNTTELPSAVEDRPNAQTVRFSSVRVTFQHPKGISLRGRNGTFELCYYMNYRQNVTFCQKLTFPLQCL
jgi:hypothetical protein